MRQFDEHQARHDDRPVPLPDQQQHGKQAVTRGGGQKQSGVADAEQLRIAETERDRQHDDADYGAEHADEAQHPP